MPNTPLNINFRELNKDYNRHKILNYYHEYLLQRPKSDFKDLSKTDRHIINNIIMNTSINLMNSLIELSIQINHVLSQVLVEVEKLHY